MKDRVMQIMYLTLAFLPLTAPAAVVNLDAFEENLGQITAENPDGSLIEQLGSGIGSVGSIMLLAVSIIAFLWVTYAAVAKFRECQAGRAEWSELLVLGVAAAALLVFVTLLLSTAGGLLTDSEILE